MLYMQSSSCCKASLMCNSTTASGRAAIWEPPVALRLVFAELVRLCLALPPPAEGCGSPSVKAGRRAGGGAEAGSLSHAAGRRLKHNGGSVLTSASRPVSQLCRHFRRKGLFTSGSRTQITSGALRGSWALPVAPLLSGSVRCE